MKKLKSNIGLSFILLLIISTSCNETYIPKPKGYYRIAIAETNYEPYRNICGYSFDASSNSLIEKNGGTGMDSCWINIVYPEHDAKIHLTYLPIEQPLSSYLDDSYQLAYKHESKASGIKTMKISDADRKVGGLVYDIQGNVASSLQFFATDSVNHFLRGSLYFNNSPNEDSIAPVLEHIKKDVLQLVHTLQWYNE